MPMRFFSRVVCRSGWLIAAAALLSAVPQVWATAVPAEAEVVAAPAGATVSSATAVRLRDYRVQVQSTNEQQANLNFDAVFFGIEAFAKPIQITADSPLVAQNPKGLIAFIASLIPVFQNFSSMVELEPYLAIGDVGLYNKSLGGRQDLVQRFMQEYNALLYFELYCGWFTAPTDFLAVLKLVQADGEVTYSPTLFTFREGEWKLVFGAFSPSVVQAGAIALALKNPRRFQMRYRNALPDEGALMPAANWRSFF